VVDDVVTTGATLQAAMEALAQAGAARVQALALLRSL
jgi:predicted amidophosphoribosyltransferase